MTEPIAVDFETFYDTKAGYSVGGRNGKPGMSMWGYINDSRFDAYWVALHGQGISYSGVTSKAPWEKLVGQPLSSHNASFDNTILEHLQNVGKLPKLQTPSMYDTADAAAYFQEPRSLALASKLMLGVEHSKEVRNMMDGRQFLTLNPSEVTAMEKYGGADAELCWRLWEKTHEKWPLSEQRFSTLNRTRGQIGLHIDSDKLDAAIETLETACFELLKAMPWVKDGGKPLSLEAMREQGRFDGIPVPASIAMGDADAVLWEQTYSKGFRWVAAVRGYRRVNSLTKKLGKWKNDLRPDGTAPFQLKYFGAAATGRFSGSGGFNLQNLPKKPAVICKNCWNCNLEDLDEDSIVSDDYTVDEPCRVCGAETRFVIDVRSMIKAPPGRKLLVADYCQVEARIALWRVGDTEIISRIKNDGLNLYEAYARAHFGWDGPKGTLKKTDKVLYQTCKACVLGGGFGAGKVGFKRAAKTLAGLDFTEEQSQAKVDGYRRANPKIVGHWRWHEDWFRISAIQKDATHEVMLASGRTVRYFDPRFVTKIMKDGTQRQEMVAEIVHGARGGKGTRGQTRSFFGGKLTENEIQATARDALRDGVLAGEDLGITTHFTVHDELVASVPSDSAEEAKRELMNTLLTASPWAKGCPLEVEASISDCYTKE